MNKLAYVYLDSQLEAEKQNDETSQIDYFLQQVNDEEYLGVEEDADYNVEV